MELNVLLRGQSNAVLLAQSSSWGTVSITVQRLLGFDGISNKVNLLESDPANSGTTGNYSAVGGTAFVGDWVSAVGGAWQNGWTNDSLEQGLLNYVTALPSDVKSAPTAVVWLHNEYDSTNANLTVQEWMSAVQADATQVRTALGQSPATTPYVFVNAIPYGSNSIDATNQAIKTGMELFAASPGFNATIGSQSGDVRMDYGQDGVYGGPHMNEADSALVNTRLALSIAETFKQYALPGSPLATGQIDAYGPEVMSAQAVSANQVLVTAGLNAGVGLNGTLSGDAAAGVGWSVQAGNGQSLAAVAAQVVGANQVLLTFGAAVPADGSANLYYGYGYGRLATGESDPGQGTAVYDAQQLPIWAPATGVAVQGAAAGSFTEQNLVTGGAATVQGSVSSIPGYQSLIAAITPDSVALVALTPNAVLLDGLGADVLVANSGSNLLDAGMGTTLMVGGTGNDNFVANATGAAVWDVISNFHPGDTMVLWGFTAGASQLSWSDSGSGAILSAVGGGIASSAMTAFQGFTAAQAAGFAETTGTSGGMSYLAVTNIG